MLHERPVPTGKGALSYGLEGQRQYGPPGPFQSTVSLNLDSVRDKKDACFTDLHGLKANVLPSQDRRLHRAGGRKFVIDASEKVFRTKKRSLLCGSLGTPPLSKRKAIWGCHGRDPPSLLRESRSQILR